MQLCLAAAVAQSRQLLLEPFRATQGAQVHLEPAILHNPVDTGPNDKWPQLNSSSLRLAKLVRLRHSLLTGGHASLGDDLSFEQQQLNPQPGSGKPWWPALLRRLFCISEISRPTSKQEQLSPSQAGQAVKLAWCRLVPAHIRGTPLHSALPLHDSHIIVEELCLAAEPPNLSCASAHDYQPQAHTCTQQRPLDKPTS